MFTRILAATDLPTAVDPVVLAAAQIARHHQAELYILHVLESSHSEKRHVIKHFQTGEDLNVTPAYEITVKHALQRMYAAVLPKGMPYQLQVSPGFPWQEILKAAKGVKIDLIVMGPHSGRAALKGVVRVIGKVGSTVEGVIQREQCPVMIVNSPMKKRKLDFRNLLVPVDFSRSCECAVCFAVRVAKHFSSKIAVFHMIPVPPFPKVSKAAYRIHVDRSQQRMKAFCKEHLAGMEHEYRLWGGALPHLEILNCAERLDSDLIIMGSHTKEIAGKWYAGSAVERVAFRSQSPVMVITDPQVLTPWKKSLSFQLNASGKNDRWIRFRSWDETPAATSC